MRPLKILSAVLLTVALGRGVRLLSPPAGNIPSTFAPEQSAALFVGSRVFVNSPGLGEVRYPVDDAINLAWVFALDPHVGLVAPKRVILAIEGTPQKAESRRQLEQLTHAGAHVTNATKETIETSLESQAKSVGSGGIFIVSFATHGFSIDGASYVLASSSTYGDAGTSIPTARIMNVAARAPRSLLFFDACRNTRGSRAPSLPFPFVAALTQTAGQVVMTISGDIAWERADLRNGAFTGAVLAGLQCRADKDSRGYVTVDHLAQYVDKRLKPWLVKHRDPTALTAIRLMTDGANGSMPLARCEKERPPFLPQRVAWEERSITAYDGKGLQLWNSTISGRVAQADVADLDGDTAKEVVVAVAGKLAVLRPNGDLWWTDDTDAPPNYSGAGTLTLSKYAISELYRKKRQIAALSVDTNGSPSSRVSLFDPDGRLVGAYAHPDRLEHILIGAPTRRHEPKIVVTGTNRALCGNCSTVFLLDPDKVEGEAPPYLGKLHYGTQIWYGYIQTPIESIEIVDRNHDGKRDISIETPKGRVSIDFEGRTIEANTPFVVLTK
jgi:hypothetical protein